MFLSRFEFNTARRSARELLSSPQRLHAAVLAAFPAGSARPSDEGRVLWRLDENKPRTLLYVVSPQKPDFTHLVESCGWPTTQTWDTGDYTLLLNRLAVGQRWAFRLTANPVISTRKNTTTRSQRYGHITVTQQTTWFLDRAGKHGFAVAATASKEPDVAVRARRTLKFPRKGSHITIATAVFEGILEVTDPATLRRALTHGIGPAKGYGCGLLTLARVKPAGTSGA